MKSPPEDDVSPADAYRPVPPELLRIAEAMARHAAAEDFRAAQELKNGGMWLKPVTSR